MNEKEYRTLRSFLDGDEPDEETYFAFSATLRIFGNINDLAVITNNLGFEPTSYHKKGDRRGSKSPPYKHDMWSYKAQVDEGAAIETHIDELWSKLKPHKEYLLELKKKLTENGDRQNMRIFLDDLFLVRYSSSIEWRLNSKRMGKIYKTIKYHKVGQ